MLEKNDDSVSDGQLAVLKIHISVLKIMHLNFTVREGNFTVKTNFSVLEKKFSLLEKNTVREHILAVLARYKKHC